jgi:hypothetical protein
VKIKIRKPRNGRPDRAEICCVLESETRTTDLGTSQTRSGHEKQIRHGLLGRHTRSGAGTENWRQNRRKETGVDPERERERHEEKLHRRPAHGNEDQRQRSWACGPGARTSLNGENQLNGKFIRQTLKSAQRPKKSWRQRPAARTNQASWNRTEHKTDLAARGQARKRKWQLLDAGNKEVKSLTSSKRKTGNEIKNRFFHCNSNHDYNRCIELIILSPLFEY